ncbi:methylated-DNA--[protein]-cysteine S-methyltransferase [Methylotenera sp. G11]|uniref:methylated-DNA--[protein]-cysteine S-methyltransferase n=1 Tax=Methylotenera sp. G11 TaxID=1506585 RepID=UPI0006491EA7|nr:methylated-DNA--[protein]-cysteine S-methyltransferase [Methylotenera sp. G11]
MTTDNDALIGTPFGAVAITSSNGQLAIELLAVQPSGTISMAKESDNPVVQSACRQVMLYLQNPTAAFDLPTAQQGTDFQQRVWQAIAAIPLGQTRTYTELAAQVGSGPRAVANACGANSLPLLVPCHRVVARNGLGGFMQGRQNGLLIKQWLLRHESVEL